MPGNFFTPTPAEIAAFPPPHYDDPVGARHWLPAFALTWQAVTTVLALGRFYLRGSRKAGVWGLDDSLVLFGWVASIGLTALACLDGYVYGIGRHVWDVPPTQYVPAATTGWAAQICFLFSTFGIKLSVLLFHRRMIKDTVSRAWVHTIWVFIGITVVSYVGAFIAYCVMCTPLKAYWLAYDYIQGWNEPYHCIDGKAFDLAITVLLGASDVWSVMIPLLMLRHYQLDVTIQQKIALNAIFCLGFLATGAGCARGYYLWKMATNADLTWYGFDLYVWSITECHLGIICACLPSLRAFFRYYFGDPARRTNTSATRSPDNSAYRDSRRWSKRLTRGSFVTEMTPAQPREYYPPQPTLPREHFSKHSPDIALYPKHSLEEMS